MPEQMADMFKTQLDELAALKIPDLKSEYDIFDDVTYEWFGDDRKLEKENQCILLNRGKGFELLFMLPVESHMVFQRYVAVANGSERITGNFYKGDVAEIEEDGVIYEK